MTVITGIEIDTEKSSATQEDWSLYFTGGEFLGINVKRTVNPAILHLKKSDYKECKGINPCLYYLYYNPKTNQYTLWNQSDDLDVCNDLGYMIGGFMVKDCKLTFVYAKDSDNCQYKRVFDQSYDLSYEHTEVYCSDCPDQSIFCSDMFTDAFQTDCIIQETSDSNGCSSFRKYSFDSGYEVQDCPIDNSSSVSGSRCCTAFPGDG